MNFAAKFFRKAAEEATQAAIQKANEALRGRARWQHGTAIILLLLQCLFMSLSSIRSLEMPCFDSNFDDLYTSLHCVRFALSV